MASYPGLEGQSLTRSRKSLPVADGTAWLPFWRQTWALTVRGGNVGHRPS